MSGKTLEILIDFWHLQENISLSMLKNLMRDRSKIQNSNSLNKKEGKNRDKDTLINLEKGIRKKKKERIHDEYMAKQDGRNKATLISDQNNMNELNATINKPKTFNLMAINRKMDK